MDRTTKFLLATIALGLWLSILMPMLRPAPVKASSNMNCTGTIKVNAWGATATSIGRASDLQNAVASPRNF